MAGPKRPGRAGPPEEAGIATDLIDCKVIAAAGRRTAVSRDFPGGPPRSMMPRPTHWEVSHDPDHPEHLPDHRRDPVRRRRDRRRCPRALAHGARTRVLRGVIPGAGDARRAPLK